MKKTVLHSIISLFILSIIAASCSTSNDVVSNGWIQKRKYQKGYYIDGPKKDHAKTTQPEETFIAEEKAVTTPEQVNAVAEPAAVVAPAATAENVTATAEKENTSFFKRNPSKKDGAFTRLEKKMEQKRDENLAAADRARSMTPAGVSPLGVEDTSELDEYLRKAILFAIIAVALSVIAAIIRIAEINNLATGASLGFGVSSIIYIVAYVFWVIAVVYLVVWLIDKFAN